MTSSAPCAAYATSPASTAQIPYSSSPNTVEWNGGQALSSEFEDADSLDDPGTSSLAQPIHGSLSHSTSLHTHEASGSLAWDFACCVLPVHCNFIILSMLKSLTFIISNLLLESHKLLQSVFT